MIKKQASHTESAAFKVSSGLKSLIGRDLITNEFVAIFELVKNSFDAQAKRVDLVFSNKSILLIDDGKGMSKSDLKEKWLFVAYSAKRDGSEDKDSNPIATEGKNHRSKAKAEQKTNTSERIQSETDYRSTITKRRAYAGSKGVGRFSCDRLGSKLSLQSRARDQTSVHTLYVDWDKFELDDKKEFIAIPVSLSSQKSFTLSKGTWAQPKSSGTILEVTGLRQQWNREKLKKLKSALAKLINPLGGEADQFKIVLHAPNEMKADSKYLDEANPFDSEAVTELNYDKIINGAIQNFIFEVLRTKTTFIDVSLSEDGSLISSKLVDRGELVYRIQEPNLYKHLIDSSFHCQIFYLNRAAKTTFSQRMGMPPVQFGSLFLFKNGFRIFPVGEENDDTFGIGRLKQQGASRRLGTRDIIGRIDVFGGDENFRESTSRAQGLVQTDASEEMKKCVSQKCFRRLERYVVDVTWGLDEEEKDRENTDGLMNEEGRTRVTDVVSKLANKDSVEVLEWSPNLVQLISERSSGFAQNLKAFRAIAENTGRAELLQQVRFAEETYRKLQQSQRTAVAAAEKETRAREQAERTANEEARLRREAEVRAQSEARAKEQAQAAYAEEKKRNLFLASLASLDQETIQDLHHHIGINATIIYGNVENQFRKMQQGIPISQDEWKDFLEKAAFVAKRILVISQLSTKAKFRLESETVAGDLAAYIKEYLQEVCPLYAGDQMNLIVTSSAGEFRRKFKPIEVAIVFDNLVSNSKKAEATEVRFNMSRTDKGELCILVEDNGKGFPPSLLEIDRIFEKGVSTTNGSGIGLYHVRKTLTQMKAAIEVQVSETRNAKFLIRIEP